jgi:hypothetical protein
VTQCIIRRPVDMPTVTQCIIRRPVDMPTVTQCIIRKALRRFCCLLLKLFCFFYSLLKTVVADLAAAVATYRSCFVNTPSARDEAFLWNGMNDVQTVSSVSHVMTPFTSPVCQHFLNFRLLHIHLSPRQKPKISPFQIDFFKASNHSDTQQQMAALSKWLSCCDIFVI